MKNARKRWVVKYEGTIPLERSRLNLEDDIKRDLKVYNLVTCAVNTVM